MVTDFSYGNYTIKRLLTGECNEYNHSLCSEVGPLWASQNCVSGYTDYGSYGARARNQFRLLLRTSLCERFSRNFRRQVWSFETSRHGLLDVTRSETRDTVLVLETEDKMACFRISDNNRRGKSQ